MSISKHASRRTRHTSVKHHTVRHTIKQGKTRVMYVDTQKQLQYADIIPMSLDLKVFAKHVGAPMNAKLHG